MNQCIKWLAVAGPLPFGHELELQLITAKPSSCHHCTQTATPWGNPTSSQLFGDLPFVKWPGYPDHLQGSI